MKKIYQKPSMRIVAIRQQHAILLGSEEITSVSSNAGFNATVSGSNGTARSRSFDDWDDEY